MTPLDDYTQSRIAALQDDLITEHRKNANLRARVAKLEREIGRAQTVLMSRKHTAPDQAILILAGALDAEDK